MEANDGFCRNQVCDDEIASRAVSLMEIQAVATIEEATRDLDADWGHCRSAGGARIAQRDWKTSRREIYMKSLR